MMTRPAYRFACVLGVSASIVAAFALQANASVNRSHLYPAALASAPPAFDASLSDPAWASAVTANGFEDITTRRPAPLDTTAYLMYDQTNVYIGFKVDQDGVPIHEEQSTNDVGFGQDDAVGVCIDTSGAGTQVYCFETTPRGVRYQQASESARYAPPWKATAKVDGSTWTAMMVIPMKDLRAPGGKNRTWLFNFIRICAATGEHYSWAYDGLMQDAQPPNWPIFTDARWWPSLTGLDIAATGGRPQPRAEIYGLESAGRDRNEFSQPNNTIAPQQVRNEGIDLTYPITSTIAAVGTLNPDFSNVEVDQQTIVPQEFRRNLVEYRPFFAQGAQYFTPDQLVPAGGFDTAPDEVFYTPSLGTFDRGEKVEGTFGAQAFGLLEVRGVEPDGSTIDDTAFGFDHILPNRTFLLWTNGVLAHHSIGDDTTIDSGIAGRNLNTGLVWGYNQALEDRSVIADPTQFSYLRNEFLDVHKPNYEIFQGYQDIGSGYGPMDGFTTIDDSHGPVYMFNFAGTTPGLKSWTGFFTGDRFETHDGTVHQADFFGSEDIVTNKLIHANVGVNVSELDDPFLTGGITLPFNITSMSLGYRDGTPTPFDTFYGAGNFANFYLQQFQISSTHPIGNKFSLQWAYDGTHERSDAIGVDGQLLRSVAIGDSLGPDTDVTLAYRAISGHGGFASPGDNLAAAFHTKFKNGSELFVNFGTPAAPVTLDRLIIKYLLRIGGGAGT
ncbi:MAG TPA: hypothetical protein VEV38_07300 [Candidatus Eremiobacteraceae bacterium]|nr:hypothetical protein [Candidatus Eremiobacteraceae bacterium]